MKSNFRRAIDLRSGQVKFGARNTASSGRSRMFFGLRGMRWYVRSCMSPREQGGWTDGWTGAWEGCWVVVFPLSLHIRHDCMLPCKKVQ